MSIEFLMEPFNKRLSMTRTTLVGFARSTHNWFIHLLIISCPPFRIQNMSNFSLSCLSFFLDLQTYYPPGLHIRRTTFIKFMPDRIASRLPPLDLRKKKGKVHPHNKPMPNKGPKDNIALCPFPYYWSRNFAKEVTTKSIELKPSV